MPNSNDKTKKADTTPAADLPVVKVTEALVSKSFNTELARQGFQKLQQQVNNLEYTEDNLQGIADVVNNLNNLKKIVDKKHKEGKQQYWDVCVLYDTVKRNTNKLIDDIAKVPIQKYNELATAVRVKEENRKREEQRIATIRNGIDINAIEFSRRVTEATTPTQLLDIERDINREKKNTGKYSDLITEAVERFDAVLEVIKIKKEVVKVAADVDKKLTKAEQKGDDYKVEELKQKREDLTNQIEESNINVEEAAIGSTDVGTAVQIHTAAPKPKRTTWKWKVVDINATQSEKPEWTQVITNNTAIDAFLAAKKGEHDDKNPLQPFTVAGIEFYKEEKLI